MKRLTLIVSALLISAGLFARLDEPNPPKHSNYSWHTVTLVDYLPGTEETARQLIAKFETASLASGAQVPVIHWFETGKYDLVITWKLESSPQTDEWTWSPEGESFLKALVEQEGSEEAATKLQDEYLSLIASSHTNIARRAN